MSGGRRILIFTKGTAVNPATRYRFLQYIPYLKEAGFEVEVQSLFPEAYYRLGGIGSRPLRLIGKSAYSASGLLHRMIDIPKARRADLVVVENQLFPYEQGMLEKMLRIFGKRIIIEFDDAIYQLPLHRRKLLQSLASADRVIVGNEHLAGFALQRTDRVSVVPTVIDMDRYPEPSLADDGDRSAKAPIRIGWIGISAGQIYLQTLHAPLRRLAKEMNIEFQVVSAAPYELPGVPTSFVPWSEEGEVGLLSGMDIGVMPLPDDKWARGKCGAKLLQYMAAGVSAVASPVGVNASIVDHGENGMLAQSQEEWFQSLKSLALDVELRRRIGRAGRRRVLEQYSLQVWGPKLIEIYRDVIEGRPYSYSDDFSNG